MYYDHETGEISVKHIKHVCIVGIYSEYNTDFTVGMHTWSHRLQSQNHTFPKPIFKLLTDNDLIYLSLSSFVMEVSSLPLTVTNFFRSSCRNSSASCCKKRPGTDG